jgi:nitrite reductase/ring-hydroxylating ferredoxin subunit
MRVTTEEKADEVFMNIKSLVKVALGTILFFMFSACDDETNNLLPDEMPFPQPFNRTINLTLPAYQQVQFDNHLYLNDIGLKGVVVVRLGENQYAAYERTCPVEPDSTCAIVTYTNSGAGSSYLSCECGEAVYRDYSGEPSKSPEPRKLREYASFLSGSSLTIESTIVN